MSQWSKPITPDFDEVLDYEPPSLTLDVTENPVVHELLGPNGEVLRQWAEREPIGYRQRHRDV